MDYVEIACESNIEELYDFANYHHAMLAEESKYIRECMESGYISVFEASDKTQSIWTKISNKVKEFFNKLVAMFRKNAVKKSEKYIAWLNDGSVSQEIRDRAKTASKTMAPYWKGDYIKGHDILKTAMTTAYSKFNMGKYDDYSWGSPIGIKSASDITDGNLNAKLKALFKFGSLEEIHVKRVTVTGSELTKIVDGVITYVSQYKVNCTKRVSDISELYVKSRDKAKPPSVDNSPKSGTTTQVKTAEESFNRFFDIEGCPLCELSLGEFDFAINKPDRQLYETSNIDITVGEIIDLIESLSDKRVTVQDALLYNELITRTVSYDISDGNSSQLTRLYENLKYIDEYVSDQITSRPDVSNSITSIFEMSNTSLYKFNNNIEIMLEEDSTSTSDNSSSNNNNNKNKEKETQDSVDSDGNHVSDTSITSAEGDATNQKGADKTTTSDSAASTYLKNLDSLFKLAVSAYATACEERFVTFVNLLKSIGDKSGNPPKFDKDGKYIPRNTSKPPEEQNGDNAKHKEVDDTDTTNNTDVS